MFTQCVFVVSILLATHSAAAGDFTQRWVTSEVHSQPTPLGNRSALILTRMVSVRGKTFSVGNITYYRIPKAKGEKINLIDTADQVRKAMGFKTWNHRTQGQAHVFEVDWQRGARFVRLYASDHGDAITYSVALVRMAYAHKITQEAELIQRAMAGAFDRRFAWLERLSLFNEAHAEGDCLLNPTACMVSDSAKSTKDLTDQITKTNANLEKLDGTMTESNSNWKTSNEELSTTNKKFGEALKQIKKGNKTFEEFTEELDHANKTGDKFAREAKKANKTAAGFEKQYERSNDILEDFMSIDHAFLWAGATAAGGALGAIAVSTAADALIQGGAALINILREAITHEKEEAKILENFELARELWEKRHATALQLEHVVDSMLVTKELQLKYGKSLEEVELELAASLDVARDEALRLERRRRELAEQGFVACARESALEKRKLDAWVGDMQVIVDLIGTERRQDNVCGGLTKTLDKLIQAEAELEEARSMILAGRDVWQKAYFKKREAMYTAFERSKEKTPEVRDEQKRQARLEGKLSRQAVEDTREQMIDACFAHQTRLSKRQPLIPMLVGRYLSAEECRTEHARDHGKFESGLIEASDRATQDRVLAANEDFKTNSASLNRLQVSPALGALQLDAYNNWFKQVADEQKCLADDWQCEEGALLSQIRKIRGKANAIEDLCRR